MIPVPADQGVHETRRRVPIWAFSPKAPVVTLLGLVSELSLFVDYGHVKLNGEAYAGALTAGGPGNSYNLKGVGAGFQWIGPYRTTLQVQVATKLGRNPARSADGKDVDGSSARTRAWFQASTYF